MRHLAYDFILAGAGVAGLSLATRLARDPALRGSRILLIDPAGPWVAAGNHKRHRCTLAFWTRDSPPYAQLSRGSWSHLTIATESIYRALDLRDHRYAAIDREDLKRHWWRCLAHSLDGRCAGVDGISGRVHRVEHDGDGVMVEVSGRWYRGRWLFDSRLPEGNSPPELPPAGRLMQRFYGWHVVTRRNCFCPDTATLMDFRISQAHGPHFFYVLPFGRRRALVMSVRITGGVVPRNGRCTEFPAATADEALADYLDRIWQPGGIEIAATEGGALPMNARHGSRRRGPRHIALGVAGGLIKPSTGYGFMRIERDSRAICTALAAGLDPLARVRESRFYRFLDGVFVDAVGRGGDRAAEYFGQLFAHGSVGRQADDVLCFLDERASCAALWAVIRSLPVTPFARAACCPSRVGACQYPHNLRGTWE